MATYKHRHIRTTSLPGKARERAGVESHLHPSPFPLHPSHRQGVILLVLLGMLALFAATALAFVVIASHSARTAKSFQKVDRVSFSPRDDLDEAMRQVLRGPADQDYRSVLRRHSLLEDLYGDIVAAGWILSARVLQPAPGFVPAWTDPKGFQGPPNLMRYMPEQAYYPANQSLQHATSLAGGQIVEFIAGYTVPAGADTGGYSGGLTAPQTRTFPPDWGTQGENFPRQVGKVLTIRDPSSVFFNRSTRIVGYRRVEVQGGSPNRLQVIYHLYQILPFEGFTSDTLRNYLLTVNHSGNEFFINGAPFAGMGAGYNPATGTNSAGYDGASPSLFPYALLPNSADPLYHANASLYSANEDYDAPDYQNMLLAMEHYDGTAMTLTRSPSLHRPALANYWLYRLADLLQTSYGLNQIPAWRVLIRPELGSAPVRNIVLQVKRRCLLRPLSEDHPDFDGSNTNWPTANTAAYSAVSVQANNNLAMLQEMAKRSWGAANLAPGQTYPWEGAGGEVVPWDVDNDGDGIPDSVWVDLGMPIRSLPDGRKYKPLVAIHCIDLDGRINLNTAGSVEQLYAKYADVFSPGDLSDATDPRGYLDDATAYAQNLPAGSAPTVAAILSRGQGVGPAEISPLPVLLNNGTLYQNLLLGRLDLNLDGRYGESQFRAAAPSGEYRWPSPGFTPTGYGAYTSPPTLESLMVSRFLGYPTNYYDAVAAGTATAYGSPLDLKGTMAVGLDFFGQPIYSVMGGTQFDSGGAYQALTWGWNSPAWAYSAIDTPYELKLGTNVAQSVGTYAGVDNPFTVGELESLLRRYDTDILRLPSRLRRLLNADPTSRYRLNVTTESWDIPVPGLAMSKELRDGWQAIGLNRPPQHLSDIIAARVAANKQATVYLPSGLTFPSDPDTVGEYEELRIDLSRLLSQDVLLGLRMDLNRPFGNGQDDNANNVVDETFETGGLAYRQAYAKTLYVLMMALVDQIDPDNQWVPYWDSWIANPMNGAGSPISPADKAQARARVIAQWAVNVVDFRDPDSIMTPFEYDVYPFAYRTAPNAGELYRTWKVDDDITTDEDPTATPTEHETGIVWGCERPELLITETLAFHDLGTVDTDADTTNEYSTLHNPPGTDPDYDQKFLPKGSLFFELYNPQSPSEPKPAEFYRDSTGVATNGVVLNKTTPAGNPVWRMAVTMTNGPIDDEKYWYLDPDEPYAGERPNMVQLERLVYFIPDNGSLPEMDVNRVTFYPSEPTAVSIEPCKYAVVGPATEQANPTGGGTTIIGTTKIGHLTENGATGGISPRRIELAPAGTPKVAVYGDGTNEEVASLATARDIYSPLALRIDQPRRLSVSEPIGGYGSNPGTWDSLHSEYVFDPPRDAPLDYDSGIQPEVTRIFDERSVTDATHPAYRYLHLQRLADPLRDWNPVSNPYKTVDMAPVDLSVINAEGGPNGNARLTHNFYSRQRGELGFGLWTTTPPLIPPKPKQYPLNDADNTTTGNTTNHAYAGEFCHSLGYVNHGFGDPINPVTFGLPTQYRGAPAQITVVGGNPVSLVPAPFAWLPWLNRPFASPLELMQVPMTAPSQLTMSHENSPLATRYYARDDNAFDHLPGFFGAWPLPLPTDPSSLPTTPGKLHQFRQIADSSGNLDFTSLRLTAPHFYRLLEYVQVPSPFVDCQIRGNPAFMDLPGEAHMFHTPFNFIPTWREPGKVNLNTIFGYDDPVTPGESLVWQGLANDHAGKMPAWANFLATRRAYEVAVATDYFGFENVSGAPPLPTRTANPFRSFAGVDLVPPVPGRDSGGTNPPYLSEVIQQGVNATVLRAAFNGTNYSETLDTRAPLFASTTMNGDYDNPLRNPFFQYQSLARLSNLATTRSNVYAVWITVGYFEVEPYANPGILPHLYQQLYQDGYSLGQELGIAEGAVTRHRAFYIIDRSIPVGFIPGQDLNTGQAVLLRRFIE